MNGKGVLEEESAREPSAQDSGSARAGRKAGRKAGRIVSALLFGVILLMMGTAICVKPVCSRVIHQAFLGRSVALRANDVIWKWFETDDIDKAIQIQERIENHAKLERIAAKYLSALADFSGEAGMFEKPDVNAELTALNEDVIQMLESELEQEIEGVKRQSVIRELEKAESQVIEILDEMPYLIGNFGTPARFAIRLYGILTSWQLLGGMALILLLLEVWMYGAQGRKAEMLWYMAIAFLVDGGMLGVILPMGIGRIGIHITSRVLGRASEIDVAPLRHMGLLFAGVAIALALACFVLRKRASEIILQDKQ